MPTALRQQRLFDLLKDAVSPETVLREAEPMSRHTTLRVGGPADFYAEPAQESDLATLVRLCAQEHVPFVLVGRGSNLLVRDGGIRGLVLCLAHPHFAQLQVTGSALRAGAGCRLKQVAVEARRAGLSGLEFLEGIPGNVGGALRMNAGAMGRSMFEVTRRLRCMDREGQVRELAASDIPTHYRSCPFLQDHVALAAELEGVPADPVEIARCMNAYSARRWASQPAAPSAGCMFKNPPSLPAGRLIQELGLKGSRIGGATISDVHGNFIVNEGHATARDVLALIHLVQERARAERGIDLETEVQILGEDPR